MLGEPVISPRQESTCALVAYSVSAAIGITLNVLVFAVVTAKFMTPQSSILFHTRSVLSRRDGRPCVLIRVGNLRGNLLFFPEVRLTLHRLVHTAEGETYVAASELEVSVPSAVSGAFTICHWISDASAFLEVLEDCRYCNRLALRHGVDFTVAVAIKAYDEVLQSDLTAYKKYGPDDFVANKLFGDVLVKNARTGRLAVDFSLFDTLRDVTAAVPVGGAERAVPSPSPPAYLAPKRQRPPPGPKRRPFTVPETMGEEDWRRLCDGAGGARLVIVGGGIVGDAATGLIHVCSFSNSVISCARLVGVPHAVVVIDLNDKPSWFTDISGSGMTPIAYDAETGTFLQDSGAISALLERHAGRAVDAELIGRLDMVKDCAMAAIGLAERMKSDGAPCAFRPEDCVAFRSKLEATDRALRDSAGAFLLGGDEPTMEDVKLLHTVVVCVFLTSIVADEADVAFIGELEHLLSWADAVQSLPCFDGLLNWPSALAWGVSNAGNFINKFLDGDGSMSESDRQRLLQKAAFYAPVNESLASFFGRGRWPHTVAVAAPARAPAPAPAPAPQFNPWALQQKTTTVSHCL